jgi:hypothetical protein
MNDPDRKAIIAAAGSGGSAQGRLPQQAGTMRFGEATFGGEQAGLTDDAGNALVARPCGFEDCPGSHIWLGADGVRNYCDGLSAAEQDVCDRAV